MLENIKKIFKKMGKKEEVLLPNSGDAAKERLHLVLMQDRANVSVDFLDLMKQEIIDVIKKYIDIDENEMDVRLTNQINEDGTNGAPAIYANIPIVSIKKEADNKSQNIIENSGNTNKTKQTKEKMVEENKENTKKETTKKAEKKTTKTEKTVKSDDKKVEDSKNKTKETDKNDSKTTKKSSDDTKATSSKTITKKPKKSSTSKE